MKEEVWVSIQVHVQQTLGLKIWGLDDLKTSREELQMLHKWKVLHEWKLLEPP